MPAAFTVAVFLSAAESFFNGSQLTSGCRGNVSRTATIIVSSPHQPTPPGSINKDLSTRDYVGIRGVFGPVVTDAADRGHKHHARRHDRREDLGIMTRAARHAHGFSTRESFSRGFDRLLKTRIHCRGCAGP